VAALNRQAANAIEPDLVATAEFLHAAESRILVVAHSTAKLVNIPVAINSNDLMEEWLSDHISLNYLNAILNPLSDSTSSIVGATAGWSRVAHPASCRYQPPSPTDKLFTYILESKVDRDGAFHAKLLAKWLLIEDSERAAKSSKFKFLYIASPKELNLIKIFQGHDWNRLGVDNWVANAAKYLGQPLSARGYAVDQFGNIVPPAQRGCWFLLCWSSKRQAIHYVQQARRFLCALKFSPSIFSTSPIPPLEHAQE
jgi:hypothetical protein